MQEEAMRHYVQFSKLLGLTFFLFGFFLVQPTRVALACEEGINRCGADGWVQQCTKRYGTNDTYWSPIATRCNSSDRTGSTGPSCEEGITRCGADGWVQQCTKRYGTNDTYWSPTATKCK